MVSFTSQIKSKCLSNLVRLDTHTQTAKEAAPHHPSYISRNCASTMIKTEWSFKLSCVLPCLMADLLSLFWAMKCLTSAFSIQSFPPHRMMWVEVCWVSATTSECHSFHTAHRRACLILKSADPATWVAAKTKCTCLNKGDKLGAVLER